MHLSIRTRLERRRLFAVECAPVKRRPRLLAMIRFASRFFVFFFAIQRDRMVNGYAPGSLIWRRDREDFIPVANITIFDSAGREFLDKIQESENHNFQGGIVRIGYFQDNNMVNFYDDDTKITGVCGEIVNILADYSNFTVVVTRTNYFGERLENRTLTGVLGLTANLEIDIIPRVAAFPSFLRRMVYTTPIWEDRFRFYIRPEWQFHGTWMFDMFTRDVWCILLALFFLLSAAGYVMQRIITKVFGATKICHNLHDYLFHTFAILCSQGFVPESLYRRNKILGLWKRIFAWLLLIVFSSNLISWLTNRKFQPPFDNIETLLNETKYQIVVPAGSMVFYPLRQWLRILGGGGLRSSGVRTPGRYQNRLVTMSSEQAYRRVCWAKDKYSIFESEDTHMAAKEHMCKLVPVGLAYFPTGVVLGVTRAFKYKRTLDIGILKLRQFGLIRGMKERWVKSIADEAVAKTFNSVNIDQVSLLFGILVVGMTVAAVIFVLETIVFTYKRNQRRTFDRAETTI